MANGEQSTVDFYADLLGHNWIKTPEAVMDDAFRWALLTIDYNWVKPFGVNECLDHWWAIWQNYPMAVFDWLGLTDRSRESIVAHAERQYKSGNIPDLFHYGERHLDFGGINPTFMLWQVQHYLKTTGDKSLAVLVAANARRVLEAYYRYEDVNENGIPGFGIQILTQEDYIATPHEGTGPAATGVEMIRIRWR